MRISQHLFVGVNSSPLSRNLFINNDNVVKYLSNICLFTFPFKDEPHATRRELILKKYPEIKKLMVVDTRFKWIVLALVAFQVFSFYMLSQVSSLLLLCLTGYLVTGVINHAMTLAVHEISHNQAFGPSRPLANKLLGIVANLPIGFPMSITFKKYHLEHHRYQGDDVIDTDIPSRLEAAIFTTTFRKLVWVVLQPFFYGFRPLLVYPKNPSMFEFINLVAQLAFDYLIGVWLGWHMVLYMVASSLVAMGLHPVAGHFISEHYIMFEVNKAKVLAKARAMRALKNATDSNGHESTDNNNQHELSADDFINGVYAYDGQLLIPETCSTYTWLNWVTFNVGYHVEHHDFPSIPGTLLPKVREIAPEFYDSLHSHDSWVRVLWRYITDPKVGPFARVKRPHQAKYLSRN